MFTRNLFRIILLNNTKNVYKITNPTTAVQPTNRFLHLAVTIKAKMYMDKENLHAHQVLESSLKDYQIFPDYTDDIKINKLIPDIIAPKKTSVASVYQMFENFKHVCCYCRQANVLISEPHFADFTKQFCDIIHLLNDDQLRDSLSLLALLPQETSVRSPNFIELWNTLDVECCRRIEKWKTNELLLICDAWYKLNLARICEFVWEALRKLGRKVIKMEPNQLVQTMFLCNIMRRPVFDMFDFEVNLAKCAHEMTLAELGVMSMGFFKTQTPIRNQELIGYLYRRVIDELQTVDDITFVSVLKVSKKKNYFACKIFSLNKYLSYRSTVRATDIFFVSFLGFTL